MSELQNKIRPIYDELQGYMNVLPSPDTESLDRGTNETQIMEILIGAIERLNTIVEIDTKYDNFKPVESTVTTDRKIKIIPLKMKLHGLINNLHGEYFPLEAYPFSGTPSTVVTNNQTNQQEMNITINQLKEDISRSKQKYSEGTKEREFLEEMDKSIKTGMSFVQLMKLAYDIGIKLGLALPRILDLLGQ